MKNVLCVLLLSMLGFSAQAASVDLKIMSFNTRVPVDKNPNDWDSRIPRMVSVIETRQPDVVGLQEADSYNFPRVMEHLPNYKAVLVPYKDENGEDKLDWKNIIYNSETVAVEQIGEFAYSDTPDDLSNRELVWGQEYFRTCVFVIFRHLQTGEMFYVFNNHLDYIESSFEPSVRLLAERVNIRQRQDLPFFVIGDMNIPETHAAMKYLVSGGPTKMTDTYRELKKEIDNDSTFHDWSGDRSGNKIDFILVGGTAHKTLESSIIHDTFDGHYPTDHFPIISTVRLITE